MGRRENRLKNWAVQGGNVNRPVPPLKAVVKVIIRPISHQIYIIIFYYVRIFFRRHYKNNSLPAEFGFILIYYYIFWKIPIAPTLMTISLNEQFLCIYSLFLPSRCRKKATSQIINIVCVCARATNAAPINNIFDINCLPKLRDQVC